jgi:hypothetical protein
MSKTRTISKVEARTQTGKRYGNGPTNAFLLSVPLVLVFAGLLASNPEAVQRAITPENHQATAMAEQETSVKGILATITQSRSTNTLGYRIVINNDGSATAEIGGASSALRTEPSRSQQFPPGAIDAKTLRRLLTEIGDVSKIPTGGCAKSVSFGTRTQITYASKTSGDLQCIRQQASNGDQAPQQVSEDLGRFVQATLGQLKINVRRTGSNH